MPTATIPFTVDDPVNARILSVSEDKVRGFHANPIKVINLSYGVGSEREADLGSARAGVDDDGLGGRGRGGSIWNRLFGGR